MKLSDNEFIREIRKDKHGNYLIFIHPEKRTALSFFFFQPDIKGHYKEDRYQTENLLEILDEKTMEIYINCHRSLPDTLKDELRNVVSFLSKSDTPEEDFQGFSASDFNEDFIDGLLNWFDTVHTTIGYPASPKCNISHLFYDILKIIIPDEKRRVEHNSNTHFKHFYINPIVDTNTFEVKSPEIKQYIGTAYLGLRQFEKAYEELYPYSRSSKTKIAQNPEQYLQSWPNFFKGAENIYIINKWMDYIIQNRINPVTKEPFSQDEIKKLDLLQQTSKELTDKICTLMTERFKFYKLPDVQFDFLTNPSLTQ